MSLLTAIADRPLAVRMRPDLTIERQLDDGRVAWSIHDPLSGKYYRFADEEYTLLSLLDGRRSLADVQREFQRRFAPQRIALAELERLIARLHARGLVLSEQSGQSAALHERQREQRDRRRWLGWSQVLALRFRGVDPGPVLVVLERWCGWLFSRWGLAAACVLWLAALAAVLVEGSEIARRLPGFHQFFARENWLSLAAVLAVTKVLHELGHGVACQRFGSRCRELGLMLLVFTPCLYCNVSDIWRSPSRWRRAAVMAAGVYVELILAAAAVLVWWGTQPGWINALALNVMFVCSVSTLAFNANPLMRFDGYYVLADLVGVVNLRQKAQLALEHYFFRGCLGLATPESPQLPRRGRAWLALYAAAAGAYRIGVALAIAWLFWRVLEPYGLAPVGKLLAAATLASLLVYPGQRLAAWWAVPRTAPLRPRTWLVGGGLATLAAAVLFTPLPQYAVCPCRFEPRGEAVYVDTPGVLVELAAAPGEAVAAGQLVARLDNVDLALDIARLEGRRRQGVARLDAARRQALADPHSDASLEPLRDALAALDEQLALRRRQAAALDLRAPRAGVMLATPIFAAGAGTRTPRANAGEVLDRRRLGAVLPAATIVGRVVDPHRFDAVLTISQTDAEFVRPGQPVDLWAAGAPTRLAHAQLAQVSRTERRPAVGERGETAQAAASARDPLAPPAFEALAPVDDPGGTLVAGGRGWARVHVGRRSLAASLYRQACELFRLELW